MDHDVLTMKQIRKNAASSVREAAFFLMETMRFYQAVQASRSLLYFRKMSMAFSMHWGAAAMIAVLLS